LRRRCENTAVARRLLGGRNGLRIEGEPGITACLQRSTFFEMLKRLIHFAMIGCLLGCPPSCWLKSAIAGLGSAPTVEADCTAVQSQAKGCSCCCHKAKPKRTHTAEKNDGVQSLLIFGESQPSDGSGTACGPCQCICGGATVAGHVAFDAGDALHFVDQFTVTPAAFHHASVEVTASERWRIHDDDVLSGRDICRRHSLMLC
jgi:hypothetical protein